MKKIRCIGMSLLLMFLSFGIAQNTLAGDFDDQIEMADQKLILQQYDEAKKIYQNIIKSSDYSVVEAYAHYKLGSLYKKQNEAILAKEEYKKGLLSLKNAGEANHQIGKYLVKALNVPG